MRFALFVCAALSLIVLGLGPASAHHGWVRYDRNVESSISGTLTAIEFVNPHVRFYMAVAKPDGTTENWMFEGGSVSRLRRAGWSADTLKVGDEVTVEFNPKRDGTPGGRFRRIVTADGRVIRGPLNGLLDGLLDHALDPGPD